MAGSSSSTRFELFFLVLWVFVSIALLTLVALRKVPIPNFIKGNKNLSILFAGIQLCIFVFLLAALADDVWTKFNVRGGGWWHSGLIKVRNSAGYSDNWDCGATASDYRTPCRTVVAAGAFTLIFGLIAIFTSATLLAVVCMSLFGIGLVDRLKEYVDVLANVQWVSMLAMVMIWSVSGHGVIVSAEFLGGSRSDYQVGASWALCFVGTILAIGAAFFFAGGAGESVKGGETSAPAESVGPPPSAPPAPMQQV